MWQTKFIVAFILTITLKAVCSQIAPNQCNATKDCKAKAICYKIDDNEPGICQCIGGYELYRNSTYYECLPVALLGEPCKNDYQCESSATWSYCKDNICVCIEDTREFDGKCYYPSPLGDICLHTGCCYLNDGGYGSCSDGRCKCPQNQLPLKEKNVCAEMRKLGSACEKDAQCLVGTSNSVCSNVCVCEKGYVISRNETACDRAALNFGDECYFDGQCSPNLLQSICIDGMCACPPGLHESNYQCVKLEKNALTGDGNGATSQYNMSTCIHFFTLFIISYLYNNYQVTAIS